MSTVGPFLNKYDFVIDRISGAFRFTWSGWQGDRAARPFGGSHAGHCEVSQFTGLKPSSESR